mgnify:FL=1
MKHPRIEVKELKKSFNETVILDQINFKVHPGESLVVIGASGSGKSVLTKCIVGLLKPDNGDIFLDGHRLDTNSSDGTPVAANSISYVFQNSALFDSLTVIENISFGPRFLNKQNEKDANEIARESMIKLDIHPKFWPLHPKELSSSLRKIVAIARALAVKPKIIIFDEPSTGLDIRASHKLDSLIRDSVKNENITAITITHDMNSALHIADSIAMLHEGKLIWSGEPSELKKSNHAEVRRFIKAFLTST